MHSEYTGYEILTRFRFWPIKDAGVAARLAMGLTEAGQGSRAVTEGWVHRDGKLPFNVSGGLKAKGRPVGATGVSQHVIVARQLSSGTAGAPQLPHARRASVQNMSGLGIANYVSVLEAT